MRLKQYIDEATAQLTKAGVDSPRLCAEVLAREVLGDDTAGSARLFCILEAGREIEADALERLHALVAQRSTGQPLAQIVGRKEFYGRDFSVTRHTLIPRPETELLVDTAIELLPQTPLHFADLGTGTGCIGLTLLAESPNWKGLLMDLCPHAAGVAATNARLLGVQDRATILRADMQRAPLKAESLQLVVSNPPYIAEAERHMVMDEVLHNEPHSALFSENNGLLHLAAVINAAAHALKNGGWVLLEHGAAQGKAVHDLLAASGIFKKIENKRDIAQLDRCTLARKGL
ncbi:MAG: peptide chain release factor N(5)-glutamine methyltransferase [Desulfovibrio sp.]|uniref:peptide chain release factor N(5)-glutamine methyltransferase n=1 Tax=Desulfovibrio sp. TaxID=885 RepID=UPI00135E44FB|nr:peptide chain release factor N(5)-glutamine methyltransferase [Desulfovibrio sp.]MTJ93652.1 peptide chain release factor N(5)-glutamine methyltransferase [Desulfovibrio sp.]